MLFLHSLINNNSIVTSGNIYTLIKTLHCCYCICNLFRPNFQATSHFLHHSNFCPEFFIVIYLLLNNDKKYEPNSIATFSHIAFNFFVCDIDMYVITNILQCHSCYLQCLQYSSEFTRTKGIRCEGAESVQGSEATEARLWSTKLVTLQIRTNSCLRRFALSAL